MSARAGRGRCRPGSATTKPAGTSRSAKAGCRRKTPNPGCVAARVTGGCQPMDDWIRVSGIGDADLPDRVKIDLITVAMYELAVAQMLMLIHGRERGARLYAE